MQHQLFLMTFENKLSLVPMGDKGLHNVLDLGTGTGIWAIDFGMVYIDVLFSLFFLPSLAEISNWRVD